MTRKATKAADSVFYKARIEAAAFNDSFNSREGASEELGMDRTRLARIELGSLNPYPEEVLMMADTYNAPELNNYYCSRMCPLGKETIQEAELLHLDRLTIKILAALRDAGSVKDSLLKVAEDGRITKDELEETEEILASLAEIAKRTTELNIWLEKNAREVEE